MTPLSPVALWRLASTVGGVEGYVAADPARVEAVRSACTRRLPGYVGRPPAEELRALADEADRGGTADTYGEGGLVAEVEAEVAALLGAPAALLLPSGTMAQQLALRHWCDLAGDPRVALHPSAHQLLWEHDALVEVQHLQPVPVGDPRALATVEELLGVAAAVVQVELPQRETGGHLWELEELRALSVACRARGTRLHLDGARLWDCGPAYGDLAAVVALADSTYVSLYKRLGGLAGAVLLGSPELVEPARVWRRRLGGTLPSLWPLALGARRGLREQLPLVPALVEAAVALADATEVAGLEVVVRPRTPLLHVVLAASPEQVVEALLVVAESSGTWLGGGARPGPRPGTAVVELALGEPSLAVPAEEAAALLAEVSRVAQLGD